MHAHWYISILVPARFLFHLIFGCCCFVTKRKISLDYLAEPWIKEVREGIWTLLAIVPAL